MIAVQCLIGVFLLFWLQTKSPSWTMSLYLHFESAAMEPTLGKGKKQNAVKLEAKEVNKVSV